MLKKRRGGGLIEWLGVDRGRALIQTVDHLDWDGGAELLNKNVKV